MGVNGKIMIGIADVKLLNLGIFFPFVRRNALDSSRTIMRRRSISIPNRKFFCASTNYSMLHFTKKILHPSKFIEIL